jgi:hypothetical protein
VISGVPKNLAAFQQLLIDGRSLIQRLNIYGSTDLVKLRIKRVEKDQPAISESSREQFPECRPEVLSFAIGVANPGSDFRITEQVCRFGGQLVNLGGKLHLPDGSTRRPARTRLQSCQFPRA